MSTVNEFVKKAVAGDAKGAVRLWNSSSREILSEYRRARDDEEGDSWHSGDYALFDELITGIKNNDPMALRTIAEFISSGIMLNEPDRDGHTPVGLLAMIGQLELLKAAVQKGGDVNAGYRNALACIFGMREVVPNWRAVADFLIDAGVHVNGSPSQEPAIFGAIQRNQRDAIVFLVEKGTDLNQVHDTRRASTSGTAMHYSLISAFAYSTDIETGKLLIKFGGDPTAKNKDGFGAIDAFYASDRSPTKNVLDFVALYSSRDDWRRSSLHLNDPPPSHFNPPRRRPVRNSDHEKVWEGVSFRRGDRVEVIRRGGLYGGLVSLKLIEASGERDCDRDMRATSGTTGTVVSLSPPYGSSQWKAVVEFDPAIWEEAENYGKLRKLGKCRGSLFPEVLKIIEAEENIGSPASEVTRGTSSSNGSRPGLDASVIGKNWKIWVAVAAVILVIILIR